MDGRGETVGRDDVRMGHFFEKLRVAALVWVKTEGPGTP